MLNRLTVLALLVLPLVIGSCAPHAARKGSPSNQITAEALSRYSTVGAAVQALRSGWLVRRSPGGAGLPPRSPVWVYRDGTRVGDAEVLTYLSTSEISVIDYYDAVQASRRWGTNHENGVIHITSR